MMQPIGIFAMLSILCYKNYYGDGADHAGEETAENGFEVSKGVGFEANGHNMA